MRKEKSESKFGRTTDTKVVEHLVEQGHFACFGRDSEDSKEWVKTCFRKVGVVLPEFGRTEFYQKTKGQKWYEKRHFLSKMPLSWRAIGGSNL